MEHPRRFHIFITIVIIAIAIVGFVLFFVVWPLPPDPTTLQRIEYGFRDSSVPPEYHRSYTIIATPQEATIVVDSYGDILAEERYAITEEQFYTVGQSLVDNRIRYARLRLGGDGGCPGGTSETVAYSDSNKELFRAYGARPNTRGECGYGSLSGNIESFSNDMRQLIPDFDTLTEVSL